MNEIKIQEQEVEELFKMFEASKDRQHKTLLCNLWLTESAKLDKMSDAYYFGERRS